VQIINNIGLEEVTALGAAYLAGLGKGVFEDINYISKLSVVTNQFTSSKSSAEQRDGYKKWLAYIRQLTT
jgi:glycerol kinase